MKNFTFIVLSFLYLSISLSGWASPSFGQHQKKRTSFEKKNLTVKKLTKSTKAIDEVILFEDFSKFTAGSELAPDSTDLTELGSGLVPEEYTIVPEWAGYGVFQAGGSAFLGMVEFTEGVLPGYLESPLLDLSPNSGKFTLKFKAKSSAEADALVLIWYDYFDTTGEVSQEQEIQITGEWKEYTVEFTDAVWGSIVYLSSLDYTCFLDDIEIVQSSLDAPEVLAPSDETKESFVANWLAVEGATKYAVNVYTKTGVELKTILSEDFEGFAEGDAVGFPSGTDISTELDLYTKIPGWTGSKVFQAGGTAKMGSSSAKGYITTPSMDLSDLDGVFTVSFDATAWSKDSTSINMYLDGVLVHTQVGLDNTGYIMNSFSVDLTGGTANSKITFEGLQDKRGRFLIDNILVTQGGGELVPLVGSPFITTDTSYKVTGLEAETTYYYTVTAQNESLVSFESEEQSATTKSENSIELDQTEAPKVYVSDDLHVELSAPETIKVYSITGTLITSIEGMIGDNSIDLDHRGVYVVKIGDTVTRKIVR